MTTAQPNPPLALRLWPGVAIVAVQLFLRLLLPLVWPESFVVGIIGGVVSGLLVALWWAFLSRAPIMERWGALVLMIAMLAATSRVVHKSIATGMMGLMLPVYAIPVLSVAFVAWAVATRRQSTGIRRATLLATVALACFGWALVRTNGITGDADSDFTWRWTPTAEDKLLARAKETPVVVAPLPAAPAPVEKAPEAKPIEEAKVTAPVAPKPTAYWPGFRGPNRNSVIPASATPIATDWSAKPPVEMWRRPIGPGWSSFAVDGDLLYTQEQRGEDELVACYQVTTGRPIWLHSDAARFWESNAGAGPRGTPTLHNGRVYTFGGTGIVNALDGRTGAVVWTRNAATDTGVKVPEWGFASSPLVTGDLVVIAAAGKLAAYDIATGEPRWYGPDGRSGYSSPHPVTIDGVPQILLTAGPGITSVSVADGKMLWEHALPPSGRISQPALTADGDLLVGEGEGHPLHRITVTHSADGAWTTSERWTSAGLKPYFNDMVVHHGHGFGFDGSILACIDLKDGQRKWKGGRYGHGQLILLSGQDVMLVLSEEGELALVSAAQDQFKELAKFPAIQGKTWNHPVLAGDVLLVRNGQEMAAFRMAAAAPRLP